MENQWNQNNFQSFAPQPNMPLASQLTKAEELKPPSAKRARPTSESTDDGGDEENYSPSPPAAASDTSNIFNYPGQIAHPSTSMALFNQQQQQQQMMQQSDPSAFMNSMMIQQHQQQMAVAQYQMLQQQQNQQHQQQQQQPYKTEVSGYQLQNLQAYNLLNLNNTHTSGSSDDDSGNSSALMNATANLDKPANEVEFCSVPGRLALLSQNKKVKVTLAEIQRRIAAPECLNASLLSAILRKAKNREGGKVLSNDLAKHSIILAPGRRKSAPNTAFTALVEAESLTLARDFQELTDKHFPFNDIAYEFIKGINTIDEWHSSMVVIYNYVGFPHCFGVLQRLMTILSFDRSPIGEMPLNLATVMHPESQKNFTHFSLITHGFGVPAHHSSWNTQLKIFKVLYEAMINPRNFCTKLGRPIPDSIVAIEPLILMSQQQHQQQNQAMLQQSGYPGMGQMSQQPQEQKQQAIPKEYLNGYLQQ